MLFGGKKTFLVIKKAFYSFYRNIKYWLKVPVIKKCSSRESYSLTRFGEIWVYISVRKVCTFKTFGINNI